jgi:hypothetical protein
MDEILRLRTWTLRARASTASPARRMTLPHSGRGHRRSRRFAFSCDSSTISAVPRGKEGSKAACGRARDDDAASAAQIASCGGAPFAGGAAVSVTGRDAMISSKLDLTREGAKHKVLQWCTSDRDADSERGKCGVTAGPGRALVVFTLISDRPSSFKASSSKLPPGPHTSLCRAQGYDKVINHVFTS